jgi:NTP pyrophosphatase (non-canonical NTP hydrolase)
MSHMRIWEVSRFLRHTLWLGLTEDPVVGPFVGAENNIVLSNPAQPIGGAVVRSVSLWLYQVAPNEHLRNAPMERTSDDGAERYPPLSVNLYYLLTPSTGNDEGDQLVLGKALQLFHDRAVMTMESTQIPGEGEELHLSLVQRTIEELAEVWEALQEPYRLSVCYEVRAVRIASQRVLRRRRVSERESELAEASA